MNQPSASFFTRRLRYTWIVGPVGEREVHAQVPEYQVVGEAPCVQDLVLGLTREALVVAIPLIPGAM